LTISGTVVDQGGLFVVISQSGETADTLEVIKLAKAQGVLESDKLACELAAMRQSPEVR
jgi:glucosamine 6-phosphate synthetase-like amidotransferase/phosphosugar isomerase protein